MRSLIKLANRYRAALSWLRPGLGVKRWLALLLFGGVSVGVGLSGLLGTAVRLASGLEVRGDAPRYLALALAYLLLCAGGALTLLFGAARLSRAILAPYVQPGEPVAQAVEKHRRKARGPKIVALGGGTGLASLLRGLKPYSSNLTAIVTVADDGGSSGRLRRSLGVLPPGDFRNCLAALADDEALITQLFRYRFAEGDGVYGHSFGNLFITAMAGVTGNFETALLEASRVLAIQGRVVPSTLTDVTLLADVTDPVQAPLDTGGRLTRIEGESQIPKAEGAIRRLYLRPESPPAYPEAVQAILSADLILAGPGSLFTSVLPNLLVQDLAAAVRASRALKVFVCNVAAQPGETAGFSVGDHLEALERHTFPGLFPIVLANSNQPALAEGVDWVRLEWPRREDVQVVSADLSDGENPWRHEPNKLARAIMGLLRDRPLRRNPNGRQP